MGASSQMPSQRAWTTAGTGHRAGEAALCGDALTCDEACPPLCGQTRAHGGNAAFSRRAYSTTGQALAPQGGTLPAISVVFSPALTQSPAEYGSESLKFNPSHNVL